MTHTPEIGAMWYEKSAPKINMDDAKIDEFISSTAVVVISSSDINHRSRAYQT